MNIKHEKTIRRMLGIDSPPEDERIKDGRPPERLPVPDHIGALCDRAEQLSLLGNVRLSPEILLTICLMVELDCAHRLQYSVGSARQVGSVNWSSLDVGQPLIVRTAEGSIEGTFFSYDTAEQMVLYRKAGITTGRPTTAYPVDVMIKAQDDA